MSTRFLQSVDDSDAHVEDDHAEYDHDGHAADEVIDEHDHVDHAVEEEEHLDEVNHQEEDQENHLPWGQVIGATFLVSLATLSGLIIIAAGSAYRGILKLRGKNNNATGT